MSVTRRTLDRCPAQPSYVMKEKNAAGLPSRACPTSFTPEDTQCTAPSSAIFTLAMASSKPHLLERPRIFDLSKGYARYPGVGDSSGLAGYMPKLLLKIVHGRTDRGS